MEFNNGFEHVRLENKWKKLRIQYREAGMSEEAIQEMYDFDVQVVNSEQRYYRHSKDLAFNDGRHGGHPSVTTAMKKLF